MGRGGGDGGYSSDDDDGDDCDDNKSDVTIDDEAAEAVAAVLDVVTNTVSVAAVPAAALSAAVATCCTSMLSVLYLFHNFPVNSCQRLLTSPGEKLSVGGRRELLRLLLGRSSREFLLTVYSSNVYSHFLKGFCRLDGI